MKESYRIAAFSDSHIQSRIQSDALTEHVVDIDRREDIDIIVHGGDFTNRGSLDGITFAAEALSRSTKPKVGVLGNNDRRHANLYIANEYRAILEQVGGVRILNGDIANVEPDSRIKILGTSGYVNYLRSTFVQQAPQGEFIEPPKMSIDEFERLVKNDFQALNSALPNLNAEVNILLLHHPFMILKNGQRKMKRIQYKENQFRNSSNAPENIEELIYHHGDNLDLILFGHVHDSKYPREYYLNKAVALNISSRVTERTDSVPYRIIEINLSEHGQRIIY